MLGLPTMVAGIGVGIAIASELNRTPLCGSSIPIPIPTRDKLAKGVPGPKRVESSIIAAIHVFLIGQTVSHYRINAARDSRG